MLRVRREKSAVKWYAILATALTLLAGLAFIYKTSDAATAARWGDVYGVTLTTHTQTGASGKSWYMPRCAPERITVEVQAQILYDVEACVSR